MIRIIFRDLTRRAPLTPGFRGNGLQGAGVAAEFDLKHDARAIVDIEFMVQYAVVGWPSEHPVLSRWTDIIRLRDELRQTEMMSEADALQWT